MKTKKLQWVKTRVNTEGGRVDVFTKKNNKQKRQKTVTKRPKRKEYKKQGGKKRKGLKTSRCVQITL